MIIKILQSKLITCKTSTNMCDVNLTTSEESHNNKITDDWITTAHKNKNVKLNVRWKHNEGGAVSTDIDTSTKNRFPSIANLKENESVSPHKATKPIKHQIKGRKILTIVNGILDYHKEFPSLTQKHNALHQTMTEMSNWFQSNLLTLNYEKKLIFYNFQLPTNMKQKKIVNVNSQITNTTSTKFLGLKIDSTLTWKRTYYWVNTKNKACYAIRTVMFLNSPKILRTVYFSYFHSIISYGVIFWGNSYSSINIFKIQNRIIRIMTKSNKRDTCPLFKKN